MPHVRLLVDSHILVWLLYEPERFQPSVVNAISAADTVYISTISLWELALKHRIGKLAYTPKALAKGVEALGLTLLPLDPAHILRLDSIHLPHKDPFDAMLLAQSEAEGCVFLTADRLILDSKYKVLDATA